jgi:putative transposase
MMKIILEDWLMRDSLVNTYLHFIWGTWDRLPLITPDNEQQVYRSIIDQCNLLNCSVIALGGVADHVHLLVRFPATITIAQFMKSVKGSTSHLMTHRINSEEFFKWQGAYAVYSVSGADVPRIKTYIQYQKEHHAMNDIDNSIESF